LLKTLSYVIFHDASSFAKTIMEDDIHPKQLRAARGLLNWSRGDLAAAAKTTERTIARLEDGASKPRASTADAIGKAFDKAGVMFIPENGGGRGVRLKKRGNGDRQGGQRITQGQRADSIQKHCT
jgi:transcriptional regulator with XRE-family HTH domain